MPTRLPRAILLGSLLAVSLLLPARAVATFDEVRQAHASSESLLLDRQGEAMVEVGRAMQAFNTAYSELLRGLERGLNGQPELLSAQVDAMFSLKDLAETLMQIPVGNGRTAGTAMLPDSTPPMTGRTWSLPSMASTQKKNIANKKLAIGPAETIAMRWRTVLRLKD